MDGIFVTSIILFTVCKKIFSGSMIQKCFIVKDTTFEKSLFDWLIIGLAFIFRL